MLDRIQKIVLFQWDKEFSAGCRKLSFELIDVVDQTVQAYGIDIWRAPKMAKQLGVPIECLQHLRAHVAAT